MSSPTRRHDGLEALPSRHGLMMHMHSNDWPRLSMFLCMAAAISAGLLVTKGLLAIGVASMWARYLPALIVAYAAFFIAVWMWLHLSRYGRHMRASRRRDAPDLQVDFPGGSSAEGGPAPGAGAHIDAGGGGFDGGGASASFDGGPLHSPSLDLPSASFDIGIDGDVGILAILAAAVLALAAFAVIGGALYVVYDAPAILAEVVFEVLLGSALVRNVRGRAERDWSAMLFRRTWKAFIAVAAAALVFAVVAHLYAPEARTALEVLHHHSSPPPHR